MDFLEIAKRHIEDSSQSVDLSAVVDKTFSDAAAEHPAELERWCVEQGKYALRTLLNNWLSVERQRARRQAATAAVVRAGAGAVAAHPAATGTPETPQATVADSFFSTAIPNVRKRLVDMNRVDLAAVTSVHYNLARSNIFQAKFLEKLMERLENDAVTVGERYTPAEIENLSRSLGLALNNTN